MFLGSVLLCADRLLSPISLFLHVLLFMQWLPFILLSLSKVLILYLRNEQLFDLLNLYMNFDLNLLILKASIYGFSIQFKNSPKSIPK